MIHGISRRAGIIIDNVSPWGMVVALEQAAPTPPRSCCAPPCSPSNPCMPPPLHRGLLLPGAFRRPTIFGYDRNIFCWQPLHPPVEFFSTCIAPARVQWLKLHRLLLGLRFLHTSLPSPRFRSTVLGVAVSSWTIACMHQASSRGLCMPRDRVGLFHLWT